MPEVKPEAVIVGFVILILILTCLALFRRSIVSMQIHYNRGVKDGKAIAGKEILSELNSDGQVTLTVLKADGNIPIRLVPVQTKKEVEAMIASRYQAGFQEGYGKGQHMLISDFSRQINERGEVRFNITDGVITQPVRLVPLQ